MDLHEEIAQVAYELYEKSGRIAGRDLENWMEAEKIVKARHSAAELTSIVKKFGEAAEEAIRLVKEVATETIESVGKMTKKLIEKNKAK